MGVGDVHYMFGGYLEDSQTDTKDRDGVTYTDLDFPWTTGFNWDDNSSTGEVVFLTIEDPIRNKLYVMTYTQKTDDSFPAMAVKSFRLIAKELLSSSSSGSYTPTGSTTYSETTTGDGLIRVDITGDGEYDFVFDTETGSSSSTDQVHSIKGRYWNGSTYVDVSEKYFGYPEGGNPRALIYALPIVATLTGSTSDFGYTFWEHVTSPPWSGIFSPGDGYMYHSIRNAGGKFGGMFFDMFRKLSLYRDGNVDYDGYPDLLDLGYTAEESRIGVWGWYTDEMSSSSSSPFLIPPVGIDSHWIPLNNPDVVTETDVDINEFLGESGRDSFYGISIPYPAIGS